MSKKKPVVLLSAYGCEPNKGSEGGVGWNWAMQLSKGAELYVVAREKRKPVIERYLAEHGLENPKFIYVDLPRFARIFKRGTLGMNIYYLAWQFAAYLKCKPLVKKHGIELAHHVSFMSLPRGSFVPFLGIPSIVGPVGGLQTVPKAARKVMRSPLMEAIRTFGVKCFRFNPTGRATVELADLIVLANGTNQDVLPKGIKEKVVTGIQIGTGIVEARPAPPASDVTTFHWSGRLVDHKGLELLIYAVEKLKNEKPDIFQQIRIVLTASGPLKDRFVQMIEKRGLEKQFDFLGWITLEEMNAVWERTDVFVFTSLRETTGMALQEAMMRGVPPIVIDNGGPGEMVTEECGFKVSGSDFDELVGALADAVEAAINDHDGLVKKGEHVRKRALEHYSWDASGEKLLRLYDRVLNSEHQSS